LCAQSDDFYLRLLPNDKSVCAAVLPASIL
jgi:hypothetical protein